MYIYRRCSNRQTIDKYTCPEDARFRRGMEAVTGSYKTRYIGGILRTAVVSACRSRLVRFARHNIWNCRRERWQTRLNGSLPRCLILYNRLLYESAQIWLCRRDSIDLDGCSWRSREINSL